MRFIPIPFSVSLLLGCKQEMSTVLYKGRRLEKINVKTTIPFFCDFPFIMRDDKQMKSPLSLSVVGFRFARTRQHTKPAMVCDTSNTYRELF